MTRPEPVGQHKPEEVRAQVLAERLEGMPALGDLTRACREALVDVGIQRTFHHGEEILCEGKPSSSFYILLGGRVKMCRTTPAGRTVILALFGPGELFGAVAALGAQPCDAAMVALEETHCLEVRRQDLFDLFGSRPELVAELLPVLTRQLVECKNCIVELTCFRVEMRFAQLLLKLADTVGRSVPGGTFIPIRLSRQELADMTGTTIETCIRVMSRWGKEGIVETQDGGFVVGNRAVLERAALG